MQRISREEVLNLAAHNEMPSISFYLPTHRGTREVQQGAIRLKNMAREATEQLITSGMKPAAARELFEPVRNLVEDEWFWQHQKDGLGVFLSSGMFRYYRLARTFPDLVVVARRFHLRPLLPLLSDDATLYVLALGQSHVRLYELGLDGIDEVVLEPLPARIAEILESYEAERQLQFHTRTPGVQGQPAIYHGHGEEAGRGKKTIAKLFREIDKVVSKVLGPNGPPLILAGVGYYFPIYREASRYRRLIGVGIPGSADQLQPQEIHREAWQIAGPLLSEARESALERYGQMTGAGKTADHLEAILAAAHSGRIDTLFLDQNRHVWGKYNPEQGKALEEPGATADNEDLLDLAAVETLRSSGNVYALDPGHMPDGKPAAAVLRY